MKRGLSLVELLLALSLLGTLMLALVSFTRLGLGASRSVAERERWLTAAEAVLGLVREDVLNGDFPAPAPVPAPDAEPRVSVEAGELGIRTRRLHPPGGAVRREYAFDPARRRLTVRERAAVAGRGLDPEPLLLLEQVAEFSCELETEPARLTLLIRSEAGAMLERSLLIR